MTKLYVDWSVRKNEAEIAGKHKVWFTGWVHVLNDVNDVLYCSRMDPDDVEDWAGIGTLRAAERVADLLRSLGHDVELRKIGD